MRYIKTKKDIEARTERNKELQSEIFTVFNETEKTFIKFHNL